MRIYNAGAPALSGRKAGSSSRTAEQSSRATGSGKGKEPERGLEEFLLDIIPVLEL